MHWRVRGTWKLSPRRIIRGKYGIIQNLATEFFLRSLNAEDINGSLKVLTSLTFRRVLFFPWGNNQKECSSAYIEAIPLPDAPSDWYVCAQFAIVIYNPTNPKKHRETSASHRFYCNETDWGFTQYLNIRQSYQRSAHTNETPIAKGGNDTNITAYVRVVKDPTGVLWHSYRDYDSRRMTGYAGLRNQGATCYMNSLLQSLYFTNAFRKVPSFQS